MLLRGLFEVEYGFGDRYGSDGSGRESVINGELAGGEGLPKQ